jgi:hypothetical protein
VEMRGRTRRCRRKRSSGGAGVCRRQGRKEEEPAKGKRRNR